MTRIASLGMYDHPAQRWANDRLWTAIADNLRAHGLTDVPDALDRTRPVQEIWRDPNLLFAQICGYPLLTAPEGTLRILALPTYEAPGCEGDTHCSVLVTRRSDSVSLDGYRDRRAAINDRGSNSGMNLFRAALAGLAGAAPFFAAVVETGSHRDSVAAIVRGNADIAAIDAVTFAALASFEPELTCGLQIIGRTPASPTLPFVTATATDPETVSALRGALADMVVDPAFADAREALFLGGTVPGDLARFAPVRALERDAVRAGYPDLL